MGLDLTLTTGDVVIELGVRPLQLQWNPDTIAGLQGFFSPRKKEEPPPSRHQKRQSLDAAMEERQQQRPASDDLSEVSPLACVVTILRQSDVSIRWLLFSTRLCKGLKIFLY